MDKEIHLHRNELTSAGKRVTRKDIAHMLGVSVSVVSRALNNSGYVKKEVRDKKERS